MKQFHKNTALVLALFICMSFFGCGQSAADFPEQPKQEWDPGSIRWLNDKTDIEGYSSKSGLYYMDWAAGASSIVRRIDLENGTDECACPKPYCRHNSSACPFWNAPHPFRVLTIPIKDRLFLLHVGGLKSRGFSEEESSAWLDVMNQDGTGRKRIASFDYGKSVAFMPKGGMACDERFLYFVIDNHPAAGFQRTLYKADAALETVTPICDLPGEEEKIVGGWNDQLVMTYTPGSYRLAPADGLKTEVLRLDPKTGETTPICEHDYLDMGACFDDKYFVLKQDKLLVYDPKDGTRIKELAVELPCEQPDENYWTFCGAADGRMTVFSSSSEGKLFYYGIDLETGTAIPIQHTFESSDEYQNSDWNETGAHKPCLILGQTQDQYLICTGEQWEKPQSIRKGKRGEIHPEQERENQYSLIDKNEFWNGTGNGVPIVLSPKDSAEKEEKPIQIPSLLMH